MVFATFQFLSGGGQGVFFLCEPAFCTVRTKTPVDYKTAWPERSRRLPARGRGMAVVCAGQSGCSSIRYVSASAWLSPARARAQHAQREAALEAITRASALDASKRLQMLNDPLLASVWQPLRLRQAPAVNCRDSLNALHSLRAFTLHLNDAGSLKRFQDAPCLHVHDA